MSYLIKLDGGKYTVINDNGRMTILRNDEAWVAAEDLRHSGVVLAMAQRIEELEVAIKAVLDGELDERGVRGCKELGIRSYGTAGTGIPLRQWETTLRNVLEQKK